MLLIRILISCIVLFSAQKAESKPRTIHVFVALCDNANQGIVPVPASLGNGQDPANNLYWGAAYGVKTFFKKSTSDWTLFQTIKSGDPAILDRLLFKHKTQEIYMLAEAYDGANMKDCMLAFFAAAQSTLEVTIESNTEMLSFGKSADLIAFIGHNGLMDFDIKLESNSNELSPKDAIMLCCYSKSYFSEHLKQTNAKPILWTTHLMAPEAYVLDAALKGWILNESGTQVDERAAVAYDKFQHCGLKGARNLFTTGY
jgi:hypothetical protein